MLHKVAEVMLEEVGRVETGFACRVHLLDRRLDRGDFLVVGSPEEQNVEADIGREDYPLNTG